VLFSDARERYKAWERASLKLAAARQQEHEIAKGLEEGCVFCREGPWAWAYPMQRVGEEPEGEFLLPPWLPVCGKCHDDLEHDRTDELTAKLHATNRGRRQKAVRTRRFLPVFLVARSGPPVSRQDAPHLVRRTKRTR
jgi:hypothetical protein